MFKETLIFSLVVLFLVLYIPTARKMTIEAMEEVLFFILSIPSFVWEAKEKVSEWGAWRTVKNVALPVLATMLAILALWFAANLMPSV